MNCHSALPLKAAKPNRTQFRLTHPQASTHTYETALKETERLCICMTKALQEGTPSGDANGAKEPSVILYLKKSFMIFYMLFGLQVCQGTILAS